MHKNEPLNNAWRIYNAADSKWYVVCTKKPDDKEKWQDAFEKEKMKANEEAQSGKNYLSYTGHCFFTLMGHPVKIFVYHYYRCVVELTKTRWLIWKKLCLQNE